MIGCTNEIPDNRRCSKQDCIANTKLMCSSHGPKHDLHKHCEWKDDSESRTNKKTIRSTKSSVVAPASTTLTPLSGLPQVDPILLQQFAAFMQHQSSIIQPKEEPSADTASSLIPTKMMPSNSSRTTRKRKITDVV